MNNLIKMLGEHVYKTVPENPLKIRNELSFLFNVSGLVCRYFPSKKLLPSMQYMQYAASKSIIKPLKNGSGSSIVSLYTPCEILHSMGVNLMFPEALSCYLAAAGSERAFIEKAENEGVPKTLCSYHKAFLGLVESGVLPKPEFVINTSFACDANHLSFRRAAEFYGIPQYQIDVPREDTEYNINYVAGQIKDMIPFIESNSGFRFSEENFNIAIKRSKNTLKNYFNSVSVRKERSLSDEMTSQMFSLFCTHTMLGSVEAEKNSFNYLKELSQRPIGKKGVRLLWVHTLPYWQDSLRDILNFTDRCEIVSCDMVFDSMNVNLDEKDNFKYMAQRLIKNTSNGSGLNRVKAVEKIAKELDADGVVWYCHWGCKQTAGISGIAKSYLEKNGYPTLVLDGDGCDSNNVNDGQTSTRMEAFLEILVNKK